MPGEFNPQIDVEQQKIEAQISKEQKELNQGERILASDSANKDVFIEKVNEFQDLDEKEKIDTAPQEIKDYYSEGKEAVVGILQKVVARGAKLFAEQKEAHEKGEPLKEQKELDVLGSLRHELLGKLSSYKENLHQMIQLETQFNSLNNHQELIKQAIDQRLGLTSTFTSELNSGITAALQEVGVLRRALESSPGLPQEYLAVREETVRESLKFLGQKKMVYELYDQIVSSGLSEFVTLRGNPKNPLDPKFDFSPKFKTLPKERQKEILIQLASAKIQIQEEIESETCPQATVNFWEAQRQAGQGNFEQASALIKKFIEEDLPSAAFRYDRDLQSQKSSYDKRARALQEKIQENLGDNQEFFAAQKLLAAQDLLGAKKLLLSYYSKVSAQPPLEGKIDYRAQARELLLRIFATQLDEIKEHFQKISVPAKQIISKTGPEAGVPVDNPAYLHYQQVAANILKLEQDQSSGKFLDLESAIAGEHLDSKFSVDSTFDVIGDELELNEGKQGLLALARKYREQGKTELARQYFEQYFREQLNKLAATSVTVEQLRLKYDSNPRFHVELKDRVDKAEEEYAKRFGEQYVYTHPFDRNKAAAAIENAMLEEMRPAETKLKQQEVASTLPPDIQPIWNEFAQMEGLASRIKVDEAGFWGKTFAISDDKLHELATRIPIEIAIIAVSGGVGAAAGRLVTRGILEYGLSQAAREAATFGVTSAGRQVLGYAGGLLVENTVFTGSSAFLHGVESGRFDLSESMREQWGSGLLTLGALGMTGRLSQALRFGRLGSFGAEMATMGAVQGKLEMKDIAMVLGLKLGHGVLDKISPSESVTEAKPVTPETGRAEIIPAKIVIRERNLGPYREPARVESTERVETGAPEEVLTSLPEREAVVGGKIFSREQFEAASNDNPLDPYATGSVEHQRYTSDARALASQIEAGRTREAAFRNPEHDPQTQEQWADAYLDKQTGVYNRNGFEIVEKWVKNKSHFAIAAFDGDFFGAFNKLKGSQFGDYVIQIIGENFQKLNSRLVAEGHNVVIVREGGEEVSVYAKDMSAQQLSEVMEQFRQDLQRDTIQKLDQVDPQSVNSLIEYLQATGKLPKRFPPEQIRQMIGKGLGPIGGSTIGITETPPDFASSKIEPRVALDALKRNADQALEHGKTSDQGGRNKVYLAETLSADQIDHFVAESKLSRERNPSHPEKFSQAESLQDLYDEEIIQVNSELHDAGRIRGREGDQFLREYLIKLRIYDPLTGVLNEEGYKQFREKRNLEGREIATYDFDIKLKPVNETLGHIGGDAYLITSARILKAIFSEVPGADPKKISIFRKTPREGTGFRVATSDFEFTPQQLEFISSEYARRLQTEFYDRIGADPRGKTPRQYQEEWIDSNSKDKASDRQTIGRITIKPEFTSGPSASATEPVKKAS